MSRARQGCYLPDLCTRSARCGLEELVLLSLRGDSTVPQASGRKCPVRGFAALLGDVSPIYERLAIVQLAHGMTSRSRGEPYRCHKFCAIRFLCCGQHRRAPPNNWKGVSHHNSTWLLSCERLATQVKRVRHDFDGNAAGRTWESGIWTSIC
ncbi:hypothetical protein BDZ85DRAFT_12340 [Elsinoe ampelina]|uniref:Uncharacterized protein n=1 Tax=Elsinoe ampelina TaxID=302913 RepID=A0A6A6GRE1_9PEZI|nr:hypothetical protein BDZ85DRAFT_12340 [Elsinoe ampelina]